MSKELVQLKKRIAKARLLVVKANNECNDLLDAMQAKRMECEQLGYEVRVLEDELEDELRKAIDKLI